jgi:hypothetical protein
MWLAGVAMLTGAFYVEEDWRGQRDWNRYRKAVESRGETLDFLSLVPKPVADEENFATTPIAQSLFQSKVPILTNDLFARADDHVFHTNNQSFLGRRHFLDLVAWKMAWTALKTGELNAGQTFESDNMDPDARRSAALAVLDGMKPDDKAFAELQEASARPHSRFPLTYDMDDPAQMSLSHLAYIKKICQRLDLMACAELAAGKPDLALSHVKLALYLTDSVKTEPVVISYLVRVLDFQLVIQAIWEGLAEHRWAESQLQELQKCLQQYDFIADMDQPLKGERTFGIREIEHYKKKGLGQLDDLYLLNIGDIDHLGQPTSHKTFLDLVGKIMPAGWYDLESLGYCVSLDAQMRGVFDLSAKRVFPGTDASNRVELNKQLPDPSAPVSLKSIVHHRAMSPNPEFLSKLPIKAAASQTAANQAAIACALERYRLANEQFPETLDALTPKFMSQVPNDVITGKPYKYHRTKDGQFVLYSVGWNETDDSGVNGKKMFDEKEGDWVWDYPVQ